MGIHGIGLLADYVLISSQKSGTSRRPNDDITPQDRVIDPLPSPAVYGDGGGLASVAERNQRAIFRRGGRLPAAERDYEVGYGKPPHHTRFVKGQSGNPRGRPRGAKNMKTLLNKALNEFVTVTENGGRRKVSKREAIATQLVNRSAKADFKAIQILLGMLRDIEGDTDPHLSDPIFTEADQQIIQRIQARLRGEKE